MLFNLNSCISSACCTRLYLLTIMHVVGLHSTPAGIHSFLSFSSFFFHEGTEVDLLCCGFFPFVFWCFFVLFFSGLGESRYRNENDRRAGLLTRVTNRSHGHAQGSAWHQCIRRAINWLSWVCRKSWLRTLHTGTVQDLNHFFIRFYCNEYLLITPSAGHWITRNHMPFFPTPSPPRSLQVSDSLFALPSKHISIKRPRATQTERLGCAYVFLFGVRELILSSLH